ncbi:MAG: GFA family protein [Asticcacaulis sp.]
MTANHSGSCHCGAVRFTCDIDLTKPSLRCNCSVCAKGRAWLTFVAEGAFRLESGADHLADYQYGARRVHHRFCKTCGIKVFGQVQGAEGMNYAVNVSALDDLSPEEFARLPVVYADGLNDRWDQTPAVTSHL